MKRLLSIAVATSVSASCFATDWNTVSEFSTYGLVGFALAKPLYDVRSWVDVKKSWHGVAQAGTSIGATTALAIVGREAFDETSSNGEPSRKFSSTYAATAFSAATHLYIRYGWEYGFPAYALATMGGYGQVESNEFDWADVAIGAAIGSATAWFFTESEDRKVELIPFANTKEVGLSIAYSW